MAVYTDGIIFSSPAVGDIDQDGENEIVVGLMYASDIFPDCRYGGVYAFDRTGNVLPGWPFEKCHNFWSSPSLGDMDEDGDLEIATSRLGFETYVIHHDGSLASGWPQPTSWNDYYSTILADVDGDGAPDVLTTAGGMIGSGGAYAWRYDGSSISGFPKLTEVDAQGPATVADIDLDGEVELLASSNWDIDLEAGLYKYRGSLYVWDITAPYDWSSMEWPHFHHDAQHTGLYQSPLPPPTPTVTPTPTDTPTPTPTPTGGPPQGDVNCDGLVNVVDALFILQFEVGQRVDSGGCPLPPPPPDTLYVAAGDVNKDGPTNVVDALFILQCEVGIPNTFCP